VDEEEPDKSIVLITGPDPAVHKQRALLGAASALLLMAVAIFVFGNKTISNERHAVVSADSTTVLDPAAKLATLPLASAFAISSPVISVASSLRGRPRTAFPMHLTNQHRNQPFLTSEMSLVGQQVQVGDREVSRMSGDSVHKFCQTQFHIPRRAALTGVLAAITIGSASAVSASGSQWPADIPDPRYGDRDDRLNQAPPEITEPSSERAIRLATDLKSLDAKLYTAFWCSHCYDQKQTLGKEAMEIVKYIECDRQGLNSRRSLCQERNVKGYPTWEIGGVLYAGTQSIEDLEEIVKLEGTLKDPKLRKDVG